MVIMTFLEIFLKSFLNFFFLKFESCLLIVNTTSMYSFFVTERYHSIDTKMKGNPLSLEEMILMTIYS